jgi:hypothetical protein
MAQRLFHPDNDAIMQSSTVLTSNNTLATMPVTFLQDQLRQKATRWGLYTVDEHNDKIDIDVPAAGGPATATLTHGTYATPAAYATMVIARLEAADPVPVWGVDYNVAATDKFRIRDAGGAPVEVRLLWSTGANAHRSAGIDMGFDVTADDTGATTYTADNVSYQSRKFIVVSKEDGSTITATGAIILEHTATQTGAASVASKVTIQGNATNAWSAPTFSEDFSALATVNALANPNVANPNVPCVHYFTTKTFAFFRLVIDDVQHEVSYAELGRFLLGTYSTVSICISDQIQFAPQDFTSGQEGVDGAAFASYRRHRETIGLGWLQAASSDHSTLLSFFQSIEAWRQWFFDFEVGTATELYYGYFNTRPARSFVPSAYYDWQMQFIEAL